jgi:glycosyltransferase involved in cell wall biosynthesis
MSRIAILYPTDPLGRTPSGIDSFIRGILRFAPAGLEYRLFGATSDSQARPLDQLVSINLAGREVEYVPVTELESVGTRGSLPLTVRFMLGVRRLCASGALRDFQVLDFHRIEPLALFKNDGRPMNVTLHQDMSILRDPQADILWRHAPWAYEWLEKRLLGRADRVYCVRQTAIERYGRLYPSLANRFIFTPTWADTSVFSPAANESERLETRESVRRELEVPLDAEVLIFVGRLDRQKDPLLLLEAVSDTLARHPKVHLLVVGDGVMRTAVEAAAQRMPLAGHVSLLGARAPSAIARLLRACDLFVLSSAYEGMPIAVLEALASGVPVVSTNVGEVRLVVRDGVSGMLSRDRSAAAFAAAVCEALDGIETMRGRPCEAAVERYHPEQVLRQIYDNHRRQVGQEAA